jgi:DNA-binding response OmpR family regulator
MNAIKVLLVEDEAVLAAVVKETLDALCVIDVMMPRKDGFSLVEDIRKVDTMVPIIFLTAKTQTADVIKGFETGADDYMKKPFSMEELILRLKSLNRRKALPNPVSAPNPTTNQIGSLYFDHHRLELIDNGKILNLSQREADLLKLLLDNKNNLLERKTALIKIWGEDNPFNARSMDVYITRLRKYLVNDSSVQILNIRGYGYKLID